MTYSIKDLLGEHGSIDYIKDEQGIVTIYIKDLIDSDGKPFLEPHPYPSMTKQGAERFLAAYFAYLAYRTRQRPAVFTNEPSSGNTQEIPTDLIDSQIEYDPTQGIVSQPLPLNQGVIQEIRYGVTQTRFDFLFSVYLQNVIKFEALKVV